MRIGVFFNEPRSAAPIDELAEKAGEAVDDGFSSIWLSNIFGLDAMTTLAVLGREVGGAAELGTAVVPTYARHPTAMAQQALTTQVATGGRFTLGIGLSHQIVVESMWGISYDKPLRHMREYLEVLLPLLRERKAAFEGETLRVNAMMTVPGEPAPVPVLLAALGPKMLELAGTVADGTITWMAGTKAIGDHIAPTIRAAAERAGREVRVVCALPVCVTDDVPAAREFVGKVLAHYGQLPSYRAMLDKHDEGAGPADVAFVGDEATVRSEIEAMAAAGATDFVAVEAVRGDDRDRTRALLKTLL